MQVRECKELYFFVDDQQHAFALAHMYVIATVWGLCTAEEGMGIIVIKEEEEGGPSVDGDREKVSSSRHPIQGCVILCVGCFFVLLFVILCCVDVC